jgi:hypothetical protein
MFRGQIVNKPKPALVVGETPYPEGAPIYACPHCAFQSEDYDILGAEPGCGFCHRCNGEFEL